MITKDNLRDFLTSLGFQQSDSIQDEMILHLDNINCSVAVDFTSEKIKYPEGIEADRDTTKNFSANENFVVLECVIGLLTQGYKPENIVLEPKTPGGREDSHFYCDILIRDNDKRPYMLIECKTMDGKEDDEFNKAWKKTLQDGGQLFNYYNTYRQAKYLVLYASDFVNGAPLRSYRLITMTDNREYLESNPKLLSFEKVSADNGTRDDFFKVWSETYGKDSATNGAFEAEEIPAFGVTKKKMTIDDLIVVDGQDIQRKYHQFAQTLRQYNVASHENAFDKLVNLFLVKVVDEVRNPKDLQFLWKGAAYDDYYSFQDRLQKLYQIGMKDYLGEDVTYIDNASIENAFRMQRNDPDAIKDTILEYFRQLKFYSNSDFGFLDVHNRQLFVQNAVILKAMVEMLQDMRLKTNEQNQFLGDLFEGFLDQGVKQNEGQFFTPTPITRFMVSSLPLEQIIRGNTDIPKAIDYACGAGHFLNEYASQIKPFVLHYKGEQSLPDYYQQIYGIEKEYRLSKVSKVSSFMYGQDGIRIVYGDALVPHDAIKDGEYKVLIANPPYSVTGFLATLCKEQRDAYMLSAEIDSKQFDTNNSIETFFIERAKQLLAPEGVAAIILPSSILSNSSNIYVKTREILLQYFDLVAIAEFGSGTFGKTGTNTVVLFLRRKKSEPELATHYRNRVEAWFSNNHGQDHRYEDADVIVRYAQHIGVPYEDYLTLLNSTPSAGLMNHEIFAAYQTTFSDNTVAKNIKKKKTTARYTQSMKDAELSKHILDSIRSVEKDKLYYFMLCESNPQPVIVVKSPTKTAETKKFLGYEWSNRKGNEGIKYLGAIVDEEDNDISANKGIQQIQTPLFDPQNLDSDEKINTLIRKNYMGEDVDVSDSFSDVVSVVNLVDMLDFKRDEFDKVFHLSAEVEMAKPITKFSIVRLSDILGKVNGDTTKVDKKSIRESGTTPVVSQENGIMISGYVNNIKPITDLPLIVFGDHSCSFKYVDFNFVRGADGTQLIKVADKRFLPTYIYYYFSTVGVYNQDRYERHFKYLKDSYIPLPPIDIQKKIVDECKKVDEDVEKAKNDLNDCNDTINTIVLPCFDKYKKVILESVCDSFEYGTSEKSTALGTVPVLRMGNIVDGTIDWSDLVYTSNEQDIEKLSLRKGDVLFNRTNSPVHVGKTAYYDDERTAIFAGYIIRVNYKKDVIRGKYLSYILNSKPMMQHGFSVMKKSINQANISASLLAQYEIPLPSLQEQDNIISQLEVIEDKKKHSLSIIANASSLKQAILDKHLK